MNNDMLTMPRRIETVALIYPVMTFMPPLGLMTLATVLEKANKQVVITSMFHYEHELGMSISQHAIEKLKEFEPDMIGVGFMSAEWKAAKESIEYLRKIFKNTVIVAGNRHPSYFPADVLNWGANFVIVGEGETTLMELITALTQAPEELDKLHGLIFHDKEGNLRFKARIEETANLDIIPAYHLLPYQKFINARLATIGRYLKSGWLSTSRGCFSKCVYCYDSNFGKRLRFRSMDSVMEDIRVQLDYFDLNCFYITDDMFAVKESRVIEFCTKFLEIQKEFKKKLYFAATARTDTLTYPMVEALKSAGCTQLSIGVESGSQRIHDFLNTNKKVETIFPAFNLLKKSGIDTFVNFIFGVPGETDDDFQKTMDIIRYVKPATVGVSFLTAYPGTPLFDIARDKGWIKKDDDSMRYRHSYEKSQLNCGLSAENLNYRKQEIYRMTFKYTLLNMLKKSESLEFFKDSMKLILKNPSDVFGIIKYILLVDIDKAKSSYRYLRFKNAFM